MDEVLKKNLVKELGLDHLGAIEQEEMLLSIGRIIYKGLFLRVLELLDEPSKDELEKLMDEGASEEAVIKFLDKRLPNLAELIEEEVANFKAESLSLTKKVG